MKDHNCLDIYTLLHHICDWGNKINWNMITCTKVGRDLGQGGSILVFVYIKFQFCVSLLQVDQRGLASKWPIFVIIWGWGKLNYWKLVFHQGEIEAAVTGTTYTHTHTFTSGMYTKSNMKVQPIISGCARACTCVSVYVYHALSYGISPFT